MVVKRNAFSCLADISVTALQALTDALIHNYRAFS